MALSKKDRYCYTSMWSENTKDLNGVYDVDDSVAAIVRTDGPVITVHGAWAQNIGEKETYIDFMGDKGGISFSGDNTPIMANAGELVLSKSQQGVLASMLTDEERGGGNAQPYLDGEKIYLGLQAYMRRSGLGEIVTSER